jgi:hypothetical protein
MSQGMDVNEGWSGHTDDGFPERLSAALHLVQQSGIPDFFLSGAFFRQSLHRLWCVPDDLPDRSRSHERGCLYT